MILYCCPDLQLRSGGIARLYRHVRILHRNGIEAAVLHTQAGFFVEGQAPVPTRYLQIPCLREGDIVVLPEGYPYLMNLLKELPVRRFGICLNWDYLYRSLRDHKDWRDFCIEAAIVVSPFIGRFIEWTMGIPYHQLDFSIDPKLYYDDPPRKVARVSYIKRKSGCIASLMCALESRRREYIRRIEWFALDDLPVDEYAAEVRRSMVFLNLSQTEGLTTSMFEAMASGCLVAGFDGVGGQEELIRSGPLQNAVLSQCGDHVNLAYQLAPILDGVMAGDLAPWHGIIERGKAFAAQHTPESEERSVLRFWRSVLGEAEEKCKSSVDGKTPVDVGGIPGVASR